MLKRPAAILALILLALTAGQALAAPPTITLSASAAKVAVDESFTLELAVKGGSPEGDPSIEGIEHFDLLGTSQGEQLSIVNMSVTRATTWRYTLRPKKAGETVNLRAKVTVGGAAHLSNGVTLETAKAGGQHAAPPAPPGGMQNFFNFPGFPAPRSYRKDDFILQARVAPATAWVGQEVIYTLAFYRGTNTFSSVNFLPPPFKKFWSEQPDKEERHETRLARLGGRDYQLTEVRQLLYPLQAGTAEIPAGEVAFTPGPFSPPVTIKSNELAMKVKPLPKGGMPANFSGVVGSFSMTASLAETKAVAGTPLTLTISITGRGALHAIPRPHEPAIDAERYDPETKDSFRRTARGTEGTRSFSYIIIPRKEGKLEIPSFTLDFFNPQSGAYEAARSAPLSVNVAAASAQSAPSAAPKAAPPTPAKTAPLYTHPAFFAIAALLLALLAGGKIFYDRRGAARRNAQTARARRAEPLARERLAAAERLLANGATEAFLAEVENALRQFLSDRLDLPPAAITPEDVEKRIPPEKRDQYRPALDALSDCFAARYAPAKFGEAPKLLERARNAIQREV